MILLRARTLAALLGCLALLAGACTEHADPDAADLLDAGTDAPTLARDTAAAPAAEADASDATPPPSCPAGFVADADGACSDLDECLLGLDDCAPEAHCRNTDGAWGCACPSGTVGDGRSCALAIDCRDGSARCHADASCTEVAGAGAFCMCNDGFVGDGLRCRDVDECALGRHTCPLGAGCVNTAGGFRCAL